MFAPLVPGGVNPFFIRPSVLRAQDESFGLFVPDEKRGDVRVRRLAEALDRFIDRQHGLAEVGVAHEVRADVEQESPLYLRLEMFEQVADAPAERLQRPHSRAGKEPWLMRNQADGPGQIAMA